MESLLQWLVQSSADPEKVSATIKGFLLTHMGIAIMVISYYNLPYSTEQVTGFIGLITGLIGTLLSLFGICRKIYYTFKKQ